MDGLDPGLEQDGGGGGGVRKGSHPRYLMPIIRLRWVEENMWPGLSPG